MQSRGAFQGTQTINGWVLTKKVPISRGGKNGKKDQIDPASDDDDGPGDGDGDDTSV